MKKILHVCLAGPVTDNWNYQDNLLPKYHKKLGYDVSLITSKYIYNSKGELVIDNREYYINNDGICVYRIDIKNNKSFSFKFRRYKGLNILIDRIKPEIIFLHGLQLLDVDIIINYVKLNNTMLYVDNHADYSNSAKTFLSKNILHKLIWRQNARKLIPVTIVFFGVLPARVDFLNSVYKIPNHKIKLLLMGADDEIIYKINKSKYSESLFEKHNLLKTDKIIVSGGKIDESKLQIFNLINAIKGLKGVYKLIIFGSVTKEIKNRFNKAIKHENIIYIPWLETLEIYSYFKIANLIVFPGRHSVLWEIAAGMGKPMLVKYWAGTTHISNGRNVEFLFEDTKEEISSKLINIFENKFYGSMLHQAQLNSKRFLYSQIAKESLLNEY